MFDIGWTELLVIGVVALIVVGPRDLPGMFRTLGRFTAKARSMAREFQRAMEQAADEAGVKDVTDDLKSVTSAKKLGLDAVKDAASKFENWTPDEATPKIMGSETAKLSQERAEAARKIREATAKKAQARLDAEAAKAAEKATTSLPKDTAPDSTKTDAPEASEAKK